MLELINVMFPIMFIIVVGIIIFSLVRGIITWNKNNQSPRLTVSVAFRICRPVPQIMIDRRAVNEYLTLIGEKELPLNFFEIIDIEDRFPVERVNKLLNGKE